MPTGGIAQSNVPQIMTPVQNRCSQIHNVIIGLFELTTDLECRIARILGSEPTKDDKGSPPPVMPVSCAHDEELAGFQNELNILRDRLKNMIERVQI